MNTQRSVSRYGTSGRMAVCVSARTLCATSTPAAPSVATPAAPPPFMVRLSAKTSRAGGVSSAKAVARKQQWRDLFDSEPPPFNRRYLESRLAYRIQELAYGGLKPETIRRLERLGEELDGGDRKKSRVRADRDRPIVVTTDRLHQLRV